MSAPGEQVIDAPRDAREVVMVCTGSPGGMRSVVEAYQRDGLFDRWNVRWIHSHLDGSAAKRLATMLGGLWTLLGLLMARRVRLVHCHVAMRGSFWRKSLFAGLARVFRVPVIWHLHGSETKQFYAEQGRLGRRLIAAQFRKATRVFVLSESWRDFVRSIAPGSTIEVVPNYVPLPDLEPAASRLGGGGEFRLLFLGLLGNRKGIYDLLEALPGVVEQVPDLRLDIGGNGEVEKVQATIARLGLDSHARTLGWVSGGQKEALLRRAHALILPSYNEGFPVSLLEAMSYGIPVITTRVGGIPEMLSDGVEGILVDAGDVSAIREAIVAVGADAARRVAMGEAARSRIEAAYSDRLVLPRIEGLYEALAGPPARPVPKGETMQAEVHATGGGEAATETVATRGGGGRPRKVFAMASGGGHWVQLLRLRPAFEGHEVVFCSVHRDYATQVPGHRFHWVPDVSRRNPLGMVPLAWRLFGILARERPDVLVTTGSAPALLAIVIARLFGVRTLWIDSIANCERLSSSGEKAARVADRCVSQWPEVAGRNGLEYWGSVL